MPKPSNVGAYWNDNVPPYFLPGMNDRETLIYNYIDEKATGMVTQVNGVNPDGTGHITVPVVSSFNSRSGAVTPGNADYLAVAAGLTGATASARFVGGTATGAPTTGTFAKGDGVIDQTGKIWICTAAGTPGTWANAGASAGVSSFNSRSGAVLPTSGDYVASQVTSAADKSSASQQAFTGNLSAPAFAASGLTGATAASRFVGATATGAPTSGTFALGDFVIDQTGKVWICTTAGTPGTWTQAGGSGGSGGTTIPASASNPVTTSTYTFLTADMGTRVDGNSASAQIFTVPTGLPVGSVWFVTQSGAGQITIAGASGVTLHSNVGLATAGQYAEIGLTVTATNTIMLTGNLSGGSTLGVRTGPVLSMFKANAQSVSAQTPTAVSWDTELFNLNSSAWHSTTTNPDRITVPTGFTGYCRVTGNLQASGNPGSPEIVYLYRNGSEVRHITIDSDPFLYQYNFTVKVTAGDYLQVMLYSNNGASVVGASQTSETSWCDVEWYGP